MTRTKPRPPRAATRPTPKWTPALIAVGITGVVVAAGWIWSAQDQARREREIRTRLDAIAAQGERDRSTLSREEREEIDRFAKRLAGSENR